MIDPIKFIKGWRLDLFFNHLLDSGKKLYKKLSDFEKELAIKVSGITAIINANLDKAPPIVFSIIEAAFPMVTKAEIQGALNKVNAFILNVSSWVSGDLETDLKHVQDYLKTFKGNEWVVATKHVINIVTVFFAPTVFIQKIEAALEYVYQTFVKGKIVPA